MALVPAGLVENDSKAPADAGVIKRLPLRFEKSPADAARRSTLTSCGDLLGGVGRGRSGARRIFEGESGGEADFAHQIERRLEIGFALAGKADDEVGGERDVGARAPHPGDGFQIFRAVCRRFIASSIRSEPDWIGRCRYGASSSSRHGRGSAPRACRWDARSRSAAAARRECAPRARGDRPGSRPRPLASRP